MLFGLSIGLAVALVVYLRSAAPSLPGSGTASAVSVEPLPQPAPVAASAERPSAEGLSGTADAAAAAADPALAIDAPAVANVTPGAEASVGAAAESKFDFYDSLAEFEVVVPQSATEERTAVAQDPELRPSRPYLVQAGSFRAPADADRRQASLALLGIESEIRRVNLGDEVYHRVIVGPLTERAAVNRVLRRLRDAEIEALPLQLTQTE